MPDCAVVHSRPWTKAYSDRVDRANYLFACEIEFVTKLASLAIDHGVKL